jgi:NADP-reducing hydrogenase subunit HndD
MEAAVRTLADILNDKDIQEIDYEIVRGVEGIKKATVSVTPDMDVNVLVAHGGANIKTVMEDLKAGKLNDVSFIELMACPGGCVNGGGQPIVSAKDKMDIDIREERAKALYDEDAKVLPYRKSHQNPSVKRIYDEFLEEPNSHTAHCILHTKYSQKPKMV